MNLLVNVCISAEAILTNKADAKFQETRLSGVDLVSG